MKSVIIKTGVIIIFSVIFNEAIAQWNTAFGIRFGNPGRGLTLLKEISPVSQGYADFILSNQFEGFCFTGLYEKHFKNHNPRIEVTGVGSYIGAGLHAGSYKANKYFKVPNWDDDGKMVTIGIDCIVGIELKFPRVPLLFSVDVKPFFDLPAANSDKTNKKHRQNTYLDYAGTLRFLFKN